MRKRKPKKVNVFKLTKYLKDNGRSKNFRINRKGQ